MAKARRYANISREEMADYLGLSTQALSNYESDKRPAKLQTLRLWAMRCGVSLDWLQGKVPPPDGPGECAPWDSNPEPAD